MALWLGGSRQALEAELVNEKRKSAELERKVEEQKEELNMVKRELNALRSSQADVHHEIKGGFKDLRRALMEDMNSSLVQMQKELEKVISESIDVRNAREGADRVTDKSQKPRR